MATSIRLAQETEQRLDYLVSHTGRTKAYYLREIIEQGIENMEVTTWLLMYWSVSVRDKSEYILLPMGEETLAGTIDYADTAKGQLRKLDKQMARRIVD